MKKLFHLFTVLIFISCSSDDNETPSTNATIAKIVTSNTEEISVDKAEIEVVLLDDGNAELIEQGVCYSLSPVPTIDDFKTAYTGVDNSYTIVLENLTPNTTYYYRAFVINTEGVGYSNEYSFKTLVDGIFDYDGNEYTPIVYGEYTWLKENLKTTHFLNGDPIQNASTANQLELNQAAFSYYADDESYKAAYGLLYNHKATVDSRNICPEGFHVSTVDDWAALKAHIGGGVFFGGRLKATGTEFWNPNGGATNSSGFTAVGSGAGELKVSGNEYFSIKQLCYFWINYEDKAKLGGYMELYGSYAGFYQGEEAYFLNSVYSCRCVKD